MHGTEHEEEYSLLADQEQDQPCDPDSQTALAAVRDSTLSSDACRDSSSASPSATSGRLLRLIVLSCGLVISGCFSTLCTKWQNRTHAIGSDGKVHAFNHPMLQTSIMFIGEALCLPLFMMCRCANARALARSRARTQTQTRSVKVHAGSLLHAAADLDAVSSSHRTSSQSSTRSHSSPTKPLLPHDKRTSSSLSRSRRDNEQQGCKDTNTKPHINPILLAIPAFCDLFASTLIYVGLNYTPASIYQMLRSASLLFTGLLSVFCLGKKLQKCQWIGMFLIGAGLVVTGAVSVFLSRSDEHSSGSQALLGAVLIVVAMGVLAVQVTVEQRLFEVYECDPIEATGWEGVFGLALTAILIVPSQYMPGSLANGRMENILDGIYQIGNSWEIQLAGWLMLVAIPILCICGVSITVMDSASLRLVIDSSRVILVWAVSLFIGWQDFYIAQLFGFCLVLFGMAIYTGIVHTPKIMARYSDSVHSHASSVYVLNSTEGKSKCSMSMSMSACASHDKYGALDSECDDGLAEFGMAEREDVGADSALYLGDGDEQLDQCDWRANRNCSYADDGSYI